MVEIKTFIEIFKQTIIEFYRIEEMVTTNKQRVNREMLDNFVTSLVLSGPLYVFVFAILGISYYEDVQKLQIIIQNANVSLQTLNVREVFQLRKERNDDVIEELITPSNSSKLNLS